MTIEHLVYSLVGLVAGLLLNNFLPKYFGKKGENLATKEDISEITNKIETVKHDYAQQLEATKAALSAQLNTHGFRYEKEYEVLNELTALLVDVRDTSLSLRPVIDSKDPSKDEDDIKRERLQRFYEGLRTLYIYSEKKRPFYPDNLYQSIEAVVKIARTEAVKYRRQDPFKGNNFMKYWDEAEKNQEKITSLVEIAMRMIRERVTKWESLSSNL